MNIKRIAPGYYQAKDAGKTAIIQQIEIGTYKGEWMVRAEWDQHRYTDPVKTYREAKQDAREMIKTGDDF